MKRLFLAGLIAGVASACAFAQGSVGSSSTTITTNYVFPPLGLAPSETVAVSLVNIAPVPTSATAPTPSCTGTVTFASSAGAIIGKANPFTVASGQIMTITLTATEASISASRGSILASVQQTTTRPSSAPCSLVYSLQTYDTGSGVTHLFLGNASTAVEPAVGPEFGR
jgi:hypothetical protein